MLDIKSNVKTLKIIKLLNTHLVLKCILKGVKAKNAFLLNVVFLSNHQTIIIFTRDIDNFECVLQIKIH